MRNLVVLLLISALIIGCSNDSPVVPPKDIGEIVFIDDGDGQLITNEPVTLKWDFFPRIDYWKMRWRTSESDTWLELDAFFTERKINWCLPAAGDLIIQVFGFRNGRSNPKAVASANVSVLPFGKTAQLGIKLIEESTHQPSIMVPFIIEVHDQWHNLVSDFNRIETIVVDWGDGLTETYPDAVFVSGKASLAHTYYGQGEFTVYAYLYSDSTINGMCSISVQQL